MPTITIDSQRIHYRLSGEGQAVLLLHGWDATLNTMAFIQDHLEPHFTVLSLDLPGFGLSPAPHFVWGAEEYADFIINISAHFGLKDPYVIGHSFGGKIGLYLASKKAIKKLILVDSAGIRARRSIDYYIKVYMFKLIKHSLKILIFKSVYEPILEYFRRKFGSTDYRNATGTQRRILVKVLQEDVRPFLPKILVPVLLVWGDQDTATPLSDAYKMKRLLQDSGLVVFNGAGHFSFLQQPKRFLLITDSFFSEA